MITTCSSGLLSSLAWHNGNNYNKLPFLRLFNSSESHYFCCNKIQFCYLDETNYNEIIRGQKVKLIQNKSGKYITEDDFLNVLSAPTDGLMIYIEYLCLANTSSPFNCDKADVTFYYEVLDSTNSSYTERAPVLFSGQMLTTTLIHEEFETSITIADNNVTKFQYLLEL